jgi:hypothetical protein
MQSRPIPGRKSRHAAVRQTALIAGLTLSIGACKKDAVTEPSAQPIVGTATAPVLLSTGSPGKDEDASVLTAADGRLFVAWFSDRDGSSAVYVSSTTDKVNWSAPKRISNNTFGNFYPNLIQDDQGIFHVVWFAWVSPFLGALRHSASTDGVNWSAEESVTTNFLVDDWVPTIAQAPNGTLLVYFVSIKRDPTNPTNQIYVTTKRPNQTKWDPVVLAAGINSATEHDHLPFIARTGSELSLVWVRYDTRDANFINNPKSDLYLSTSADGLSWSPPLKVTSDPAGQNLFPQIYQRHDGTWSLLWLSTRTGSRPPPSPPVPQPLRRC